MCEYLRHDFVRKGQDWVFIGVEVILHGRPFTPEATKTNLKHGYLSIEVGKSGAGLRAQQDLAVGVSGQIHGFLRE
jgi:hypothetical protein